MKALDVMKSIFAIVCALVFAGCARDWESRTMELVDIIKRNPNDEKAIASLVLIYEREGRSGKIGAVGRMAEVVATHPVLHDKFQRSFEESLRSSDDFVRAAGLAALDSVCDEKLIYYVPILLSLVESNHYGQQVLASKRLARLKVRFERHQLEILVMAFNNSGSPQVRAALASILLQQCRLGNPGDLAKIVEIIGDRNPVVNLRVTQAVLLVDPGNKVAKRSLEGLKSHPRLKEYQIDKVLKELQSKGINLSQDESN